MLLLLEFDSPSELTLVLILTSFFLGAPLFSEIKVEDIDSDVCMLSSLSFVLFLVAIGTAKFVILLFPIEKLKLFSGICSLFFNGDQFDAPTPLCIVVRRISPGEFSLRSAACFFFSFSLRSYCSSIALHF